MVLNNSNANGIGGMLAIIDASGTAGGDVVGPTTTGVTLTETAPNSGLYTVTASVSDVATGNAAIQAAEVRADAAPVGPFAMSASDAAFDTATEAVTSTTGQIDTTTWAAGTHTVFVRGRDALGNWGPYASATVAIDRTGPTISALTLNPNPSSGSVDVVLSGTASDVATGNGNVVAAEYWLGRSGRERLRNADDPQQHLPDREPQRDDPCHRSRAASSPSTPGCRRQLGSRTPRST